MVATGKAPLSGVEPTSNDGKKGKTKDKAVIAAGKLMGKNQKRESLLVGLHTKETKPYRQGQIPFVVGFG
jgi:hypothetical protein